MLDRLMSHPSTSILLTTLAATSFLSGCAALKGVSGALIGVSVDESKAAIRNKDYPNLKALCTGEIRISSNIANYQDDTFVSEACTAAIGKIQLRD